MSKYDDDSSSELDPLVASSSKQDDGRKKWTDVWTRYLALFFMCFIGFGAYFVFDSPAALVDDIKRDMKISTATYAGLYSWYSLPSVVMCFIGGYLVDRVFGVRLGSVLFLCIVLFGQLLFAIGALKNKIIIMYIGRFILG